jgi:hypothetical protein
MKKLILLFSLTLLVSCASNTEQEVQKEKMQEKSHMSKGQMHERILKILETSKKLTPKQKEDFMDLHAGVMHDVRGINNEIRRLKVVLFKNLSTGEYKRKKIESIKKQIIKQYNRRLNLMFDSLYKTQKILGVGSADFYQNEWFPVHFSL